MGAHGSAVGYLIWSALLLGVGIVLARNRRKFVLTKLRVLVGTLLFFAACMQLAALAIVVYLFDLHRPGSWIALAFALLPTFAVLYVWRVAARTARDEPKQGPRQDL